MFFSSARLFVNAFKKLTLDWAQVSKVPLDDWGQQVRFPPESVQSSSLLLQLIRQDQRLFSTMMLTGIIAALLITLIPLCSSLFAKNLHEVIQLDSWRELLRAPAFLYLVGYVFLHLLWSVCFQYYMKQNLQLVQVWLNRISSCLLNHPNRLVIKPSSYAYALSQDSDDASGLAQTIPELARVMIQIIVMALILLGVFGWVAGIALATTILLVGLSRKFLRLNQKTFDQVKSIRQSRGQWIESMVRNLFSLWVYQWIDHAVAKIQHIRNREQKALRLISEKEMLAKIISIVTTLLTMSLTMVFYVKIYKEISPFAVVLLLLGCGILKTSLMQLPQEIQAFSNGMVSLRRIQELMRKADDVIRDKKFPVWECDDKGNIINIILSKKSDHVDDWVERFCLGWVLQGKSVDYIHQPNVWIKASVYYNLTIDCSREFNTPCEYSKLYLYLKIFGLATSDEDCQKFLQQDIAENAENFSGGEKQRLSIIRALVSSSDILVFHHAMNAIDESLASHICQQLPKLKNPHATLFFIHHEPADMIFDQVIDSNDLLEKDFLAIANNDVRANDLQCHTKNISDFMDREQANFWKNISDFLQGTPSEKNQTTKTSKQMIQWIKALWGGNLTQHLGTVGVLFGSILAVIIPYAQFFLLIGESTAQHTHYMIIIFGFTLVSICLISMVQYGWNILGFNAVTWLHNRAIKGLTHNNTGFEYSKLKSILVSDLAILDQDLSTTFQKFWHITAELILLFFLVSVLLPQIIPVFLGMMLIYWRLQRDYRGPALLTKQAYAKARLNYFSAIHQLAGCFEKQYQSGYRRFYKQWLMQRLALKQTMFFWRVLLNRWFSVRIMLSSNALQGLSGLLIILLVFHGTMLPLTGILIFTFLSSLPSLLSDWVRSLSSFEAHAVSLDHVSHLSTGDVEKPPQEPMQNIDSTLESMIAFDQVDFSYEKNDHPLIYRFSLKLDKGDKILLYGPSGAGKSTLIKLLLLKMTPDRGRILFKKPLRCAYVPQQGSIFPSTLRENLDWGNRYHENKIQEIIQILGLNPQMLDKEIEPYSLSKSETQKILLARAMLAEADLLVMDEATADISEDEESSIMSNIVTLFPEAMIVAISHRQGVGKHFGRMVSVGQSMH